MPYLNKKRKLVDDNGKEILSTPLQGFFAKLTHKVTKEVMWGGERPLDANFLGSRDAALGIRDIHKTNLEKQFPEYDASVIVHHMELVGPLARTRLESLLEENRIEKTVTLKLAQKLVEERAKSSLELNPLENAEQKMQDVLLEARTEVAEMARALYEAQLASQSQGLVDPDGNPIQTTQDYEAEYGAEFVEEACASEPEADEAVSV